MRQLLNSNPSLFLNYHVTHVASLVILEAPAKTGHVNVNSNVREEESLLRELC